MPQEIAVRMAEIAVSKEPEDILVTLGLGSCIGLCLFDPKGKIGGMAHIVLPEAGLGNSSEAPGKYADTAVTHLVFKMKEIGATKTHLRAALCGGAHVFNFGVPSGSKLDIGQRNYSAVLEQLKILDIPVIAEDCGGSQGRTVHFYMSSGIVTVRTAGTTPKELTCLNGKSARPLLKAA